MKKIATLFALTFLVSLTAHSQVSENTDSVYTKVDVQPEFPGGYKALGKIVDGRKNHKYPEEARKNKIEGKCLLNLSLTKMVAVAILGL